MMGILEIAGSLDEEPAIDPPGLLPPSIDCQRERKTLAERY
jgi:hypothetical protein